MGLTVAHADALMRAVSSCIWKAICTTDGPLPERRLGKDLPFADICMDYAGLFELKGARRRPRKKIHVLVITCMAICMTHFEPSSCMKMSEVANTLSRFTDIRGIPKSITTDNQTSSVKADKDLQEWALALNAAQVQQAVSSWQRPTRAPNSTPSGFWKKLRVLEVDPVRSLFGSLCPCLECAGKNPTSAQFIDSFRCCSIEELNWGQFLVGGA